jgi:D-alanyl-D-alanine carboxypeptidase
LRRTKTRLVATLLALVCATTASAQTFDAAKLDLLFDRLLEKNKGMGGLTVARDGKVIYSRSFGYRQISDTQRQPLAADTKYRIASITKTCTAVMVVQLVEEGRLKLTDTLDKFFPQIPNASRITIAQLLHHRSGIPGMEQDGTFGRQARTQDEIVARIAQGKPNFEPDTQHSYANTGYIVLGFIVEEIDGKSYRDALRDRITSTLGLRNTYAGTGNTDSGRNEALSNRYIGGWRESEELDFSRRRRRGRDRIDDRGHGGFHPGALRSEADLEGKPHADADDAGRRGQPSLKRARSAAALPCVRMAPIVPPAASPRAVLEA